jgi:hypothetical protein
MMGFLFHPPVVDAKPRARAVQKKNAVNAANKSAIAELKQAQSLLQQANRDYHGHRAKAAHEVHHAILALRHGHHNLVNPPGTAKGPQKPPGKAVAGKGPVHEAQALSDQQLKQAEQIIAATLAKLSGRTDARASLAATDLQKAVKEIELALAAVKNQPNKVK